MPIRPLSDATSRVLVSTQALNDATSVVKELVENALDAGATSISIEISANTVEKIIIKDDGVGVGVEDRQLLCKRGCTSKITNLDDLAALGGSSLGFRGTALASVAELSKEVTIVTKVDGEQPATTLTFGPTGKLLSSGSASHNVGTTVRVENFLASVPVRRQFVVKNAPKVLDEIKRLLQGYAFTRPIVKLSLKVLKAKNDKFNWSFAACKGGDALVSAAVQVVGKATASICRLHTTHLNENTESAYSIEALVLDTRNNDLSKAQNGGQYLSIDGRPVSHDKGVMKEVVKMYKSYLKHATESRDSIVSKPFLILCIKCAARSYDVNIEPSKDVVLFHDKQIILELAEKLFVEVYGDLKQQGQSNKQRLQHGSNEIKSTSFDVLLPRKRFQNETDELQLQQDVRGSQITTESSGPRVGQAIAPYGTKGFVEAIDHHPVQSIQSQEYTATRSKPPLDTELETHGNMYSIDDGAREDVTNPSNCSEVSEDEETYDPNNNMLNNPFVRAKLLSVQRPREPEKTDNEALTTTNIDTSRAATSDLRSPICQVGERFLQHLPTPKTSPFGVSSIPYQNPGPPFPRRNKRLQEEGDEESSGSEDVSSDQPQPQLTVDPEQLLLGDWVNSPQTTVSFPGFQKASVLPQPGPHTSEYGSPLGRSSYIQRTPKGSKRSSNIFSKPLRSPLKTPQLKMSVAPRHEQSQSLNGRNDRNGRDSGMRTSRDDDDLRHILEFEIRKKVVNQQMKSNQSTLNPADLARIQRDSKRVDQTHTPTFHSMSESPANPSNTTVDLKERLDLDRDRFQAQKIPSKTSNPHHNRYLAAVRSLQNPDQGTTHPDPRTKSIIADPETKAQNLLIKSRRGLSVTTDDPRAFLISLNHSPPQTNVSDGKPRRYKSTRLPFETIAPDLRKHNTLATPPTPMPPPSRVLVLAQALAHSDPYIKTGITKPIEWSPAGKDVKRWQETLEELVKTQYKVKQHVTDNEDESFINVPSIDISLARALKAHVDSR